MYIYSGRFGIFKFRVVILAVYLELNECMFMVGWFENTLHLQYMDHAAAYIKRIYVQYVYQCSNYMANVASLE